MLSKLIRAHPILNDLIRLRADVGGKIKENERQAGELAEQAAAAPESRAETCRRDL
jgi:hypothetical protein